MQLGSTGLLMGAAAASGEPYRRVMSFSLFLSKTDYDTAVTQFPTSVPASWVSVASTACQTALDNASGLLTALESRYETTSSNVSVIESRGSSTGTSPS